MSSTGGKVGAAAATAGGVTLPPATRLPPLYLNINLLNKDDAINAKVNEKAGNNVFGKAMKFAATKIVSDETIVSKLAASLSQKVPEAINEMGITAEVTKRYQNKSFMVLMIQVTDVDKLTLLLATKGPDYAHAFSTLLGSLEKLELSDALNTIDVKVGEKICESLAVKLGEVIPAKVKEQGLEISCVVCDEKQQATFFFDQLERLHLTGA